MKLKLVFRRLGTSAPLQPGVLGAATPQALDRLTFEEWKQEFIAKAQPPPEFTGDPWLWRQGYAAGVQATALAAWTSGALAALETMELALGVQRQDTLAIWRQANPEQEEAK